MKNTNHKPKTVLKTWKYEHVTCLSVKDGDTLVLEVDMGNRTVWRESFRLYGINTPEIIGATKAKGQAAKIHLENIIQASGIKSIETIKPDKYGRTLVSITLGDGTDVVSDMIARGWGVPYFGGKK